MSSDKCLSPNGHRFLGSIVNQPCVYCGTLSTTDHPGVACCNEAAEWDDAFDGIMYGNNHNGMCENYDGAPLYRQGMGPGDPVRCDND